VINETIQKGRDPKLDDKTLKALDSSEPKPAHSHFIKEKERSRDILESPTIEVVPVPLISKVKAGLVDRYRTHLFKGMALKS
jgi:hypothetical protein